MMETNVKPASRRQLAYIRRLKLEMDQEKRPKKLASSASMKRRR
jgi:hypothetical protein